MDEKLYEEQRTFMRQRLPKEPFVRMIRKIDQYIPLTKICEITGIPPMTMQSLLYASDRKLVIRKHAVMIHALHKQLFKAVRAVQKTRESVQKF